MLKKGFIRRFITAACLTIWTLFLCIGVQAADYQDALASLGLFHGTGNGYETEKCLTRGEGTVMLLRLLGLEQAAEDTNGKSRFSDGGWADPYISYADVQGLVNGVSETAFGTDDSMTQTQYAALLLRALDFRDGVDFTYEQAAETLEKRLDTVLSEDSFDRGEAARLSWLALEAGTKSGESLRERLMSDGAFTRLDYDEAAHLLREKPVPKTTTVLFYVIASDLEEVQGRFTEDLEELLSLPQSEEITLVFQTGGTREWKNDSLTGGAVERSVVQREGLTIKEQLTSAEMTQSDTLTDFIRWGTENFKADRYLLVLWDHGYGTMGGFGKDETKDGAAMSIAQLQKGLDGSGIRFDLIVFDACLMGTLETAYALRGTADYIVASEELLPAEGLHYPDWLAPLYAKPHMNSYELAKLIVTGYDMRCGTYLGGKTGMAVISPVWAKRVLCEWYGVLLSHEPETVNKTVTVCHEMGLRDGGFDQFDLGQLAEHLGAEGGQFGFYLQKLIPFCKNGSALTGFSGAAAYVPYRHQKQVGAVCEILADCGLPEDYINLLRQIKPIVQGGGE